MDVMVGPMLLGLLFPAAVVALIVLGIIAVANGRREPDPSGRRAYAIYQLSVTFLALFTALFALYALVSAGTRLALGQTQLGECVRDATSISCRSDSGAFSSSSSSVAAPEAVPPAARPDPGPRAHPAPEPQPPEPPPAFAPPPPAPPRAFAGPPPEPPPGFVLRAGEDPKKERVGEAVQAGLVAVAAAVVLLFHATRIPSLVAEPGFAESPARRTYLTYLYAVCLVAVLTALISGAVAGSGLVRVIAPDALSSGPSDLERKHGAIELASNGFLAVAVVAIFAFHWRRTSRLRPEPQQQ